MSADASSFTDKWSGFLASVWTQVRAALVVGGGAGRPDAGRDDYAGHQTRNGLGSLDIGAGRSRIGE